MNVHLERGVQMAISQSNAYFNNSATAPQAASSFLSTCRFSGLCVLIRNGHQPKRNGNNGRARFDSIVIDGLTC